MSGSSQTRINYSLRINAEVMSAVRKLCGEDDVVDDLLALQQKRHTATEVFARIAWSRIAEPGDAIAGSVIHALGAGAALVTLIEDATDETICSAMQKAVGVGSNVAERQLRRSCARWRLRLSKEATERDAIRAASIGLRVITPGSVYWPVQLNDLCEHAPMLLWTQGNLDILLKPLLSVVGARAASSYGMHVTAELVEGAVHHGRGIVSGAAYGIDAVAHRTALALDMKTVAVLAGGIDRVYPAGHADLLAQVADHGVVCSEPTLGTAPSRWRFLMRNRIIAALSGATLVPEAGIRSGSLNTAGHASQLGRDLGAVPGLITSESAAGCHKLIREYNAELITGVEDLASFLAVSSPTVTPHAVTEQCGEESGGASRELSIHARVIDAMPLRGYRLTADIAKHGGLSVNETLNALAELVLLGCVREGASFSGDRQWAMVRTNSSS